MNALVAAAGIVNMALFVPAVLLLNLTLGPDTAYIVARSIAQGPRAGLLSTLGISLGCCVHSILCAAGLTALLAASASAFLLIKFAGAVYLIVIGARMAWSTRQQVEVNATAMVAAAAAPGRGAAAHALRSGCSGRMLVMQGFVTNVFNPKVLLFYIAFLPQFISREAPSKALAVLVLGSVLCIMSSIYNASVACLAARMTRRMRTVPALALWLQRGVAAALVALGARLALLEQPL